MTVQPVAASGAPSRAWRAERLVPGAAAALALGTVAAGEWIRARGGRLGVPLPPFDIHLSPRVGPLAPLALVVLPAAAALTPVLVRRVRRPLLLAAALYGLSLALGVSLNVARGGITDLWRIFNTGPGGLREARQEYLPGLWALRHGVPFYVSHFPSLMPWLPVHVKGNPPGPLVALHLLGIGGARGLAALCIGLGALSAPLACRLGRTLAGERPGRLAGAMTAFSPALLLWGVTSADYAFAALGLIPACLLVGPGRRSRAAGALCAAACTFLSWLLFAIPVWAVLVAWRREGRREAVALGVAVAVAVGCVYGALALGLGYDPVATLKATDAAYRHGIPRPYAYWLLGSPVAWGLALGPPIAWPALRALGAGRAAAVALFAVVAISAVAGFTKAETERIWLPFVPLAAVAAATVLEPRRLSPVLWLLAGQGLAVQLLFDTIW